LPASGALFGAFVAIEDGLLRWTSTLAFESEIQRELTIDKQGYAWSDIWPSAYEYWSRDQGRTLSFEWNAQEHGGQVISWKAIANGQYDSLIDARAAGIKAFAAPAFFVFHHEPEDEVGQAGTTQDFINAYRHVHDRFIADGVTNLTYSLVLLSTTYASGDADQYYPGGKYVDLLGADGYNWYKCPGRNDPWTSFHDVFVNFYNYGLGKGKPMFISEWGSNEDPGVVGHKAQWITDAAATLKTWPEVKVETYYNNGPPAASCNWRVDSSPSSLAAFQAMGADPYFNPPWPVPNPPPIAAYVSMEDNLYSSPVGYLTQGLGVDWLFNGTINHTVTDASGMGLFDSGILPPGSTYLFTPKAAANYNYKCTLHANMTATLRVPLVVLPLVGGLSTPFTVTWASGGPPSGYVYDVKIKRPGSSSWSTWQDGVSTSFGIFLPDSGKGTYSFHSRIRNTRNGAASWYSQDVAITIS